MQRYFMKDRTGLLVAKYLGKFSVNLFVCESTFRGTRI